MVRIEVSVRCINEYDNTTIYSCDAIYSSEGNTVVHSEIDDSEVDDHTKALASDALYMTSTLLKNQIKTEPSEKEIDVVRKSE